MNNLWHFGSSYGLSGPNENVFSYHIAERFNKNLIHKVVSGSSNFMIFSKILEYEKEFKKNDIVLINWTWLSRGEYIDKYETLKSTNIFIKEKNMELINPPDENELNLDWILNWSYDWNVKLFKYIISNYFINLKKRGIESYNVWFSDDSVYQNSIKKNFSIKRCNLSNILDFNPNYLEWLGGKNWLKTNPNEIGGGHYKNGIQKDLAEEYINKIVDINSKII